MAGHWLRARLRLQEKSENTAYLFLLPYLLFFVAFGFLPVFLGFFVSLTDWSVVGDYQWLGLRNYIKWLGDSHLVKVTLNTLRYTVLSVPSVAAVSLAMALYVNKKLAGYVFSRIVFFAPYVVAVTVTALLWKWILGDRFRRVELLSHAAWHSRHPLADNGSLGHGGARHHQALVGCRFQHGHFPGRFAGYSGRPVRSRPH